MCRHILNAKVSESKQEIFGYLDTMTLIHFFQLLSFFRFLFRRVAVEPGLIVRNVMMKFEIISSEQRKLFE
jgi:hypothetical protein